MVEIVPTITAESPAEFAAQIDRAEPVARRLHVDLADGQFISRRLLGAAQIYGIEGVPLDLHLMVEDPAADFETLVALHPSLVIIHAESRGDLMALIGQLRQFGIKPGLALRPETTVGEVTELLPCVDHLLIFTGGGIGSQGGGFSAAALPKIAEALAINPKLEIAVDGGIDPTSAPQAVAAGAHVLDCGSFIQKASDTAAAYAEMTRAAEAS